jgi:hypothetical protein
MDSKFDRGGGHRQEADRISLFFLFRKDGSKLKTNKYYEMGNCRHRYRIFNFPIRRCWRKLLFFWHWRSQRWRICGQAESVQKYNKTNFRGRQWAFRTTLLFSSNVFSEISTASCKDSPGRFHRACFSEEHACKFHFVTCPYILICGLDF